MTSVVIAALASLVRVLARLLGAGASRADRIARDLTGAPDPVDQHAAEVPRAPADEQLDDVERELARRQVMRDGVRSAAADAVAGRRRALAEQDWPGSGLTVVPTLVDVEVLDDTAAALTLHALAKRLYGNGPIFVAPGDGDDLAALLARDGILLARRMS